MSANKLTIIEEILSKINTLTSHHQLLDYLVDKCIEVTGALTGSIMLLDKEKEILEVKVFRGFAQQKIISSNLKIGQGVTGKVAQDGKSLLVNNVDEIDYYIKIRDDLKSELAIPLKLKNKVFGVISVDSDKLNAFNEEHLNILEAISVFASQLIQKIDLIEELNSKIERQDLLLKIANILEEEYELKMIFQKVMDFLSKKIELKRGFLVVLDNTKQLKTHAGYKISESAIKRGNYNIGEGIIGNVFKKGSSIKIKDISESKLFLNKMKIKRETKDKLSFISVPIKVNNRTIGVLSIEKLYISDKEFNNTFDTLKLVTTLISDKINNYYLYLSEKERLIEKNRELSSRILKKSSDIIFIGKNPKIIEILETANLVSGTDATILITGNTGTGKEVLAKIIHNNSTRTDNSLISINCAAIPDNLLESELFGHVRGAFTGAVKDKKGKFELADQSTIFLDEIGDLDLNLQVKLLRALQEKIIEPVGSEKSLKVDVRIIAATNKDLNKLVLEGKFREDLYYRLNVLNIHIPSLSERKDDVLLFIEHFIKIFNKKYNRSINWITARCQDVLTNYEWPGNVRELENIIERAAILCKTNMIDINDLPGNISKNFNYNDEESYKILIEEEIKKLKSGSIYESIANKIDKELIEYALITSDNNHKKAAEYLGLHRNTLYIKMKKLKSLGYNI